MRLVKKWVQYSVYTFVVNQFWFSASTFVVTIATFAKPENVGGNFTETHNKMDTINIKQTVGQSIQEFYDKYDFGEEGGVNEKYAWIKFGFFSIPIPNAESRRNNIYLHDINHIVTGNNTTWEGESAVAAWEIATGGWNDLYLPWLLTLWAMGLGVLFYPKNVLKSFRNGLTMNNALTCGLPKTEIYKLSILELRQFLSNKPKSDKNPYVWMFISFMTFLTPFIVGFIGILTIIKLF